LAPRVPLSGSKRTKIENLGERSQTVSRNDHIRTKDRTEEATHRFTELKIAIKQPKTTKPEKQ
jgi:hypothetical protein